MRRHASIVLFSIGLCSLGLTACSAIQPAQQRWTTRLADSRINQPDDAPDFWVGASSSDSTPSSIKDLSDHGQAAYVEAVAKLPNQTLNGMRAAFSKGISLPKPVLDTTQLDRTLVIVVTKKGFHPADRLVRTEIELKPKDNFHFGNYEAAATSYSTINIETLGATRGATNGVELDPVLGGILGAGKLTAGTSESYTDQAVINSQIEQLTVYKRGGSLIAYRESERGIDLTGSTLVKLPLDACDDVGVDQPWVVTDMTLFDEKEHAPAQKPSIDVSRAKFAHAQSYAVTATLHYVLRHVVSGDRTYSENDDTVQFQSGDVTKDFVLVPPLTMKVDRWELTYDGRPIHLEGVDGALGHTVPFQFIDRDAATLFERWLQQTGSRSIGTYRVLDDAGKILPASASFEVLHIDGGSLPSVQCPE